MPTPCPECAANLALDDSGAWRCPQCGLVAHGNQLPCPSCGMPVEVQADQCPACGEPTTLFGQVMSRHDGKGRAPVWLSQARARASGVRQDEDLASNRRFDALMEIDRRRLQAVERDSRLQAVKDRRTLVAGLALAALLAVAIVVVALITGLR